MTGLATNSTFTLELQLLDFKGDAIDTALRKLLSRTLLPKETQQIDQAMEDFAKHYHKCNPTLAGSFDSIYAVAFSILLLHTDAHNKNVKRKMNKDTFIKHTKLIEGGDTVYSEILDVMYDNIVYSHFTYANEQPDKPSTWFFKKPAQVNSTPLHDLYPKLKQLMPAINTFKYKPTPNSAINITNIYQSIEQAQLLQLAGVHNRQKIDVNKRFVVRVCKAGLIECKYDISLGGHRSPARGWRPFGMILTGCQIMLFGDLIPFQSWIELHQPTVSNSNNNSILDLSYLSSYLEHPNLKTRTPMTISSNTSNLSIISPSATSLTSSTSSITATTSSSIVLRPLQILSLSNAVCLYDESYQKYPHVFRLITGDGQQLLLRGDSSKDIDDWVQKINYVSAMKSTGVRLRPKTATFSNLGTTSTTNHYYDYCKVNQQQLGIEHHYHHLDGNSLQHWTRREANAKSQVISLKEQQATHRHLLAKEQQLRDQLMVLIPMQKVTKDRMVVFAETIGKRLLHHRMTLQRLECYQEFIEMELSFYKSFKDRGDNLGGGRYDTPRSTRITRKRSAPLPLCYSNEHSSHADSFLGTTMTCGSDGTSLSTINIPTRSSSLSIPQSGNEICHGGG
ncbi:hypothetical protein BC941DRAFT_471275 [Chlamydoabsidia padenii]|nr:hypothetical protein BC941DRAFT_471275 [Chlamydoabsidia padenii]